MRLHEDAAVVDVDLEVAVARSGIQVAGVPP
jgi:hypothetical protein